MADWWLGEETVGELISRARGRLGKSQYALAEALREVSGRGDGVPDRSMVARWETGRRVPTPYWRIHLAASCSFRQRNLTEQPPLPRPAGPATQKQRERCRLASGCATFSPIQAAPT